MTRLLLVALAMGLSLLTPTFAQENKNPRVVMDTSLGKITIELFADKSPSTTKNFLQYVDDKHYDGTLFHRVIADFMIQGGGFEPGLREKKTRPPIENEAGNGLSNERGTLAMARTDDPNSATAQFFINVVDNKRLDRNPKNKFGYAVFGKVLDGMDVVDEIRRVKTDIVVDARGKEQEDVPVLDVLIRSVRRIAK